MKQKYISPALEVISLNTTIMIAGSRLTTGDPTVIVSNESYTGTFSTREQAFDDDGFDW